MKMNIMLLLVPVLFFCSKRDGSKVCTGLFGGIKSLDDSIELRWKDYISLNDYLTPFWEADTIYEEISQIIKTDSLAQGTLLFEAGKILSVKSADLKKTFVEDKDFFYKDGKIILPAGSAIPFILKEDLLFNREKPGWSMQGKTPGTFVFFTESTFFRSKQISVTYVPKKLGSWKGPVPVFAKRRMPHTIKKFKSRQPFKIVFYGNSIETGANCSSYQNQSPYMPSWPQLIVYKLRQTYGEQIRYTNKAVGGTLAQWGKDNVSKLIIPENPDLVIIGFGMNDGSAGVPPEKYRETIKGMVDEIKNKSPKTEFVLIAPMLANPHAIQSNIQALYKAELDKLKGKGIVVADLTGVDIELLKHKNYQDQTGNNINHPNDYMSRWYAQFILGFLVDNKSGSTTFNH
jgi:lysophospholipase L1-like esterase